MLQIYHLLLFKCLGNALLPGQPFGQNNPWLMSAEDKAIQEARESSSMAYIKNKDMVRDQLATIFDKAQKKYDDTGDDKYLQIALQAKNDIMAVCWIIRCRFFTCRR